MDFVERDFHIKAPPQLCYDTVTDYESYPNYFPEFSSVIVLDKEDGADIVEFTANYGKEVEYTLRIAHDDKALKTSWTYVGGGLKDSQGGWSFEDDGQGGTNIHYRIAVQVGFFVPKMVSDRLISSNIPKMFQQLSDEVARRQSA